MPDIPAIMDGAIVGISDARAMADLSLRLRGIKAMNGSIVKRSERMSMNFSSP